MINIPATVGGIGLGATTMFLLDPRSGNRRRAQARQWITGHSHDARRYLDAHLRDLGHRTLGLAYEARYRLRGSRGVDDDLLRRRVASKTGRCVSHPKALDIIVKDGVVTVRGTVLESEVDAFLDAVRKVPGTRGVRNELKVYRSPAGIPDLQGGRPRHPKSWRPAVPALVAAGVALLATQAWRQRTASPS